MTAEIIPQDIREKARATADDIRQRFPHDHAEIIARAILAERERCERDVKESIEQKVSDARNEELEEAARILSVRGKKYLDDNPFESVLSTWGRGVGAGLYEAVDLLRARKGEMR